MTDRIKRRVKRIQRLTGRPVAVVFDGSSWEVWLCEDDEDTLLESLVGIDEDWMDGTASPIVALNKALRKAEQAVAAKALTE